MRRNLTIIRGYNARMSAPLIEFAQFAHPQQWWLRRGPPPWLDDPRWFARAFRASLVLGVMGTATGWLTIGASFLLRIMEEEFGSIPNSEMLLFVGPGLWFGSGVLVPLSRWLGRGWVMTILALPVSMAASFCAFMVFLVTEPSVGDLPEWVFGGINVAGYLAGFTGAAIMALWMGNPRRGSAWIAGLAASVLASLHCGLFFSTPSWGVNSVLPRGLSQFVMAGWLFVGFQSLTAVGLGARLWERKSDSAPVTPHGDTRTGELQ